MTPPEPVTLLALDVSGKAGVARAVVNLANELVAHRPVRVLSVLQRSARPTFALDPRVELEVLVPPRGSLGRRARALAAQPTRLRPLPADKKLSALTDRALSRRLAALGPGLLVSSRPSLHLAAVTWAAPGVKVVGWDHKNFPTRMANERQKALLTETVPRLDGYVVLTYADADDYLRTLPGLSDHTHLQVIRNLVSWDVAPEPAPLDSRVVLAVGRLVREKGFDRLVRAFAPVARAHPDWQLHVHGEGDAEPRLRRLVEELGVGEQVRLPGYCATMPETMSRASVFAMTSRAEGFPMVLIEAMSRGLPLVAMDCPRGPGEIVVDGKNGLLVEDGDVAGFTSALMAMVEHDELRRRCGRQAHDDARQYDAGSVVAEWLALFDRLTTD